MLIYFRLKHFYMDIRPLFSAQFSTFMPFSIFAVKLWMLCDFCSIRRAHVKAREQGDNSYSHSLWPGFDARFILSSHQWLNPASNRCTQLWRKPFNPSVLIFPVIADWKCVIDHSFSVWNQFRMRVFAYESIYVSKWGKEF